jgi:hypothetical protein
VLCSFLCVAAKHLKIKLIISTSDIKHEHKKKGVTLYCSFVIIPHGCLVLSLILQTSERLRPVSAYFAFETNVLPKLALGNGSRFKYMLETNMVLHTLIKSGGYSAKFTCKPFEKPILASGNKSIVLHECNRYDSSKLINKWTC